MRVRRRHPRGPQTRVRHAVALPIWRVMVATALAVLSLVVTSSTPASAAPAISLNKTASAEVLVGGVISYSLTASNPQANPDAVPEYNLSFRDVLPIGVTYDAGSTSPTGYGEPRVITDPDTGQQTLIWQNVADLAPGSTASLSFTATARRSPTLSARR